MHPITPIINLGILAHVDAGKTSLTERLLFDSGVLATLGRVDDGTTRTDAMALERQRGITIRSAVTSLTVDGVAVNLIDTPGHPDFIAEVERALAVLDGAVLVLSAVEGVQSQSVLIWRALRRLAVPSIIFVNKVDRAGADPLRVVAEVQRRLDADALVLTTVDGAGTPRATVDAVGLGDPGMLEKIASADAQLLDSWADGRQPTPAAVSGALARAVGARRLVPVVHGSALTGVGVGALTRAVTTWLPRARPNASGVPAGVVFKIDRDDRGRHVYVRMRAGTLELRDRVMLTGRPAERITSLRVFERGGLTESATAVGGQIAMLGGLTSARIGDTFGPDPAGGYRFAPALLETVVEPCRPEQRAGLFAALRELAEQDPLIALRSAEDSRDIMVSLYGEVQKEVIAGLLADGYGIEVTFHPTTVACIERVIGTGAAVDHMKLDGNPYLATIGLRVEPLPVGDGVRFELEVERGSMPPAFFAATEEGVHTTVRQGRFGWPVTDCLVTMTHAAYCPRQSHAHQKFNKAFSSVGADFRHLAPVVLMAALDAAGTVVCEPVDRFDLEVPSGVVSSVLAVLGRCGGVALSTDERSEYTRIAGTVPTAQIPVVAARLPGIAHGQSVFTSEFDGYEPVRGKPPVRARTGPDPADRVAWFRERPR